MSTVRLVGASGGAFGDATVRLVGLFGGATNQTLTITGPAQAEAFDVVQFICDSSSVVSGWTFTFNSGSAGGTLTLTVVGTDDTTAGIAIRQFTAPAIALTGGTVSIHVVAHATGGDQVADYTCAVWPPVEYIRRAGIWQPRAPMRLLIH